MVTTKKLQYSGDTTTTKIPIELRDHLRKICIIHQITAYEFLGCLMNIVPEEYVDKAIVQAKSDRQKRELAKLNGENNENGD